ncbi:MAG: aldo/keto reductase [Deltaproteobacteria bacterium]|jgi:predicted aldo/keto reductase-like oxidoreductase|nr:aldo/keto reductase [Deltaproteobacteria bacterium]
MIYKTFKELTLSALGFGNMRLPTLEGGAIDRDTAHKMIAYAYDNGVNYFDTAYGYHGGDSERFIGESLKRYPRESWHLVSKFPGYEKRTEWKPHEVFQEQLDKCQVEYFDLYMLHNVYEHNLETYLNKDFGIVDALLKEKERGRIRHFGFSVHGRTETFLKFLEVYADIMEFSMIELNALDWNLQDAKVKYEVLKSKGIPILVMEPVRGGKLSSFSAENEAKLKAMRPDESIAAWAFRWIQTLDSVLVTLSGMTTEEQVVDNVKTFSQYLPLNPEEKALYEEVVGALADFVPCTLCRYCIPDCPKNLDIPTFIKLYNDCRVAPSGIAKMAVDAMRPSERPGMCIECGNCVEVCPQSIDIPAALKDLMEIIDKVPRFVPAREED